MQIMPGTAAHRGLPMSMIHEPEANVAAAARYMTELQGHFSDVGDPSQRMLFALASYKGGYFHIRDAMSLARKHGQNPHNWGVIRNYIPVSYTHLSVRRIRQTLPMGQKLF